MSQLEELISRAEEKGHVYTVGSREEFTALRTQLENCSYMPKRINAIDTALRDGHAVAPEEDGWAGCELILWEDT